jgi:Ca2+-binding EF-hand superfamily protein
MLPAKEQTFNFGSNPGRSRAFFLRDLGRRPGGTAMWVRVLGAVVLAIGLAAGGAPSFSQTRPVPRYAPETFDSFGVQPGDRISLKVWQAHEWSVALARNDADHDGRISAAEFVSELCAMAHSDPRCSYGANLQFQALNRNRNGFLDRDEMDAWSANLFHSNDANHDGYVTPEEMERTASHPLR